MKPPLEGVNHAYEVRRIPIINPFAPPRGSWRIVAIESDGRETPILDMFAAEGNARDVALSLNEAYSRGVDDGLALAREREAREGES